MVGNVESIREPFPGIYADAHIEGSTTFAVVACPFGDRESTEEIIVEAVNDRHAREIASIALERDYDTSAGAFTIIDVLEA